MIFSYEKDLSTQQEKAPDDMRFSQKDVHGRGAQSFAASSPKGPQASHSLNFPKSARLLKRKQFKQLSAEKKYVGKWILIEYRQGLVGAPQMGVTVYRQCGKAVFRNRFKRLAREAFRLLHPHLYPHLEMNIIARKGIKEFTLHDIIQDLLTFNDSLDFFRNSAVTKI